MGDVCIDALEYNSPPMEKPKDTPPQAKILIVDDEPELRQSIREVLEAHNYQVIAARDGQEGLARALNESPDLIILDVRMPRMDGFAMLSRLRNREHTAEIPVVMLTAKGETPAIFEAEKLKATDYFIKPFDLGKLLSYIKRHLREAEPG